MPTVGVGLPGLGDVGRNEPLVRRSGRQRGSSFRPMWGPLGQHEPSSVRPTRKALGLHNRDLHRSTMRSLLPGSGSPPKYGKRGAVLGCGFGAHPSGTTISPVRVDFGRTKRRRAAHSKHGGGPADGDPAGGMSAGKQTQSNGGLLHPLRLPRGMHGSERGCQRPQHDTRGEKRRRQRRRELRRRLKATEKALFKEQNLRVDAKLEYEVGHMVFMRPARRTSHEYSVFHSNCCKLKLNLRSVYDKWRCNTGVTTVCYVGRRRDKRKLLCVVVPQHLVSQAVQSRL